MSDDDAVRDGRPAKSVARLLVIQSFSVFPIRVTRCGTYSVGRVTRLTQRQLSTVTGIQPRGDHAALRLRIPGHTAGAMIRNMHGTIFAVRAGASRIRHGQQQNSPARNRGLRSRKCLMTGS